MRKKLLLSTALLTGLGTAGVAQGFRAAELGIEYRNVTDIEGVGSTTYFGSAQVDGYYGISVAVDATTYDFELGPSGVANLTTHVLYQVNPTTGVGVFAGADYVDGDSSDLIGAEFKYDFGVGDAEGYLGRAEDSIERDLAIFGLAGTYSFASGFDVAVNLDGYSGGGFSGSALEIGGFYTLLRGPKFGATIGLLDIEEPTGSSNETTFGLQASIALGRYGGTTFGRRSANETVRGRIISP